MAGIDLSGSWQGYYEQEGARHGIAMQVAHKGSALVGRMQDADTVLMGQLPAECVPDGASERPEMITSLPADSIVEGEVTGQRVRFKKSYRGKQTSTVWLGDRQATLEIDGHTVWYQGTLDRAGTVLQGEWTIPAQGDDDPGDRGRFELRRQ